MKLRLQTRVSATFLCSFIFPPALFRCAKFKDGLTPIRKKEIMFDFTNCSRVFGNKVVVNTTPHPITFALGDGVAIVPNAKEALLNARAVEEVVSDDLVRTNFVGTDEGSDLITDIQNWAAEMHPGKTLRIIGSIIAAQAYPGAVVGMTPAPGFERVAPAEKRMSLEKFTTFAR